jgi:hypothetical protein
MSLTLIVTSPELARAGGFAPPGSLGFGPGGPGRGPQATAMNIRLTAAVPLTLRRMIHCSPLWFLDC